MSSSRHDEWSDKIDSDNEKEHNRGNNECKMSESVKDPENIAMLSVQSKARTSGLHESNRLKQQQKRKTSFFNGAESEQPEVERKRKKFNDKESELDNHRLKKFEISEVHPSSGLKTSLHGVAYQLKLLMLWLKRGIDEKYQFRMATEMNEAEKFDDLVFQYKDGDKTVYRFLQAKHKLDEDEKISIGDLLNKPDGNFDLQKYFNSYCKIKRNLKFSNENSRVKDLIICTNIGFKLGDKRGELQLSEDIFDIDRDEKILKTDLLRFKEYFVGREEIVSVLKNAPDVIRLAKDLVDRVPDDRSTGKKEKSQLLELYQFALIKEVIDDGSKKFQRKFVTDAESLSSEAKNFRRFFEKVFKDSETGKKMCPDMNNFRQVIGEKKLSLSNDFGKLNAKLSNIENFVQELVHLIRESKKNNEPYVEIIKTKNFKTPANMNKLAKYALFEKGGEISFGPEFLRDNELPGNLTEFRKQLKAKVKDLDKLRFVIENFPKSRLPSITDIDSDIKSFLDTLLFAVNQPNEMKLSSIISNEMGDCKGINLIDTKYLTSRFQKYLFDWMKDKKGRFLTYVEGKNFFDEMKKDLTNLQLTGLTREYSSHMEQINIHFTEDKINELRKFLEPGSTMQLFILMSIPDTILGLIQVHQILEKMSDYQKDDSFIFIRLNFLLCMQGPVFDTFALRSKRLLIIECNSIEVNEQTSYGELLEAMRSDNNLGQIILITDKDNTLVDTLRSTFSDKYKEKEIEVNGLLDLEKESRNKLIEKRKVKFQGQEVYLSELIVDKDKESMNLINAEALSKLIKNKALEIGKPFHDSADVGNYYICRTLQRREKIDRSFLDNKLKFYVTTNNKLRNFDSQRNQDIVVISDNDKLFKELGNEEKYKKHNIHWLKSENRHFVWQESKGALFNLRNFVDRKSVKSIVPRKVTDISEKVVIIAAEPGMGKSTLLTHLSVETTNLKPTVWIARINLSLDCSGELKEMIKKRIRFDDEKTIDFLLATAKFTSKMLEYKFLKYCYKTGKMILLFDGFDEISPYYKKKVIELFKFLTTTRVKAIWVTTRPYDIKTHLEDELGSFSYVLQEFSGEDQKLFLKKFWTAELNFVNFDDRRANVFINTLLDSFSKSINDRERRFISIPLHIRMIAVVCKDTFQNFNNFRDENISDLKEKLGKSLELLSLYENFFNVIFEDIHFCEKRPDFDRTNPRNILTMDEERDNEINKHGILALQNLYPNDPMIPKQKVASLIEDIKQSKNKTGIIDRVIDDRPVFVHQSFAEYFVALWFSRNWQEENVKQFLMERIFNKESVVILNFLDRMLAKDEPGSSQTPDSCIKYHEGANEYELHEVVLNNDVGEVERLLNEDKSLLDTTDNAGRTPVHLAAARGHIKIVQSLLKVIEENAYHSKTHPLSVKDELFQWTPLAYADKNSHWDVAELLLQMGAASEDMFEAKKNIKKVETLLHKAAEKGYLKIAEFLLGEGVMIDARDEEKRTPLHLAALKGHLEMVKYLSNDHNANLEAVNEKGNRPLHYAAFEGNLEIVKYFINKKNANFEAVNEEGNTPLHVAAQMGNLEVVKHLVDENKANSEAVNKEKKSALCLALVQGKHDVVKYLMNVMEAKLEVIRGGSTPLHFAAQGGNLQIVKYLVDKKKANIEAFNEEGTTPLHIAASNGNLEIVEYLVGEKNANFEAVDEKGKRPLHFAAWMGDLKMVKYLVDDEKANFQATAGEGTTPLHFAAQGGNLQIVKYLVDEKKVNFETVDGKGKTPLHFAAINNNFEIVEYLVDKKNADFEAVDVKGNRPLHFAVMKGNFEIVKYLVDKKNANIEAVVEEGGSRPLHFAAWMGDLKMVKYLVDEKKANFEAVDIDKRTPLYIAVWMGYIKMVEYLVGDKNANLEAVDGKGITLLHVAAMKCNFEIVKYLVDKKNANLEAVDENGNSPLHFAAYMGHLEMVKYLVDEKKANFEAVNRNEDTILHVAVWLGYTTMVEYLVDAKKATVETVDAKGNTPLHIAAMKGNLEIVEYLVDKKKANLEAFTEEGITPLHIAASNGNLEIVEYLVGEKNANFEAVNKKGNRPLHLAASEGNFEIVKYLVDEKNANFEAVDEEGNRPLHFAASMGDLKIVKYLVDEQKANFEAIAGDGTTPLHCAAHRGNLQIVKYLVEEKKANFEAIDKKGNTPLHIAAEMGDLKMVKYFVDENEANFETVARDGTTPLHCAALKGNLEIVKYLVADKKANLEAVDGKGTTPLQSAALKGNLEIVKYLVDQKNANSEAVDEKGGTPLHLAA